jgi:hypothetical protein
VSATLETIQRLAAAGEVRISEHGYDELADDGILARDVMYGISAATLVEDYPEFGKGPTVLVLQFDAQGKPLHVVWGIPRGHTSPAVLVRAYRPDPARWSSDFLRRLK